MLNSVSFGEECVFGDGNIGTAGEEIQHDLFGDRSAKGLRNARFPKLRSTRGEEPGEDAEAFFPPFDEHPLCGNALLNAGVFLLAFTNLRFAAQPQSISAAYDGIFFESALFQRTEHPTLLFVVVPCEVGLADRA